MGCMRSRFDSPTTENVELRVLPRQLTASGCSAGTSQHMVTATRKIYEEGLKMLKLKMWHSIVITEVDESGHTLPDWSGRLHRRQLQEQDYVESQLQPSKEQHPLTELEERLQCWKALFKFQETYRHVVYQLRQEEIEANTQDCRYVFFPKSVGSAGAGILNRPDGT